jgi:serine/threonine protein phosphatase PrpC
MTEQAADSAVVSGDLVVRAVLRTDVGLVRSENQDFGAYTTPSEERLSHPGGRLMIVADGMGGHRGGATASRLAAETVKAQYLGSETTDVAAALRDALTRANARIFSEAQANPELRGMGTTTSALAVRAGEGWFAHVGDSRIYRVRNDEIKQLTEDHSLVASMVREGLITPKEAETHPRRNVLQRSLGVAEDVEIDVQGPFDLQEGDTFILCSDGLHGLVKELELRDVAKLNIDQAADEFVRLALTRGAPDNVTVIVARVERGKPEDVVEDTKLDETQELDAAQFDETVRDDEDTAPIPAFAVSDDSGDQRLGDQTLGDQTLGDQTLKVPALSIDPPAATGDQTLKVAALSIASPDAPKTLEVPAPKPKKSGLATKLFLIVVVLIAAAGAWFYWAH